MGTAVPLGYRGTAVVLYRDADVPGVFARCVHNTDVHGKVRYGLTTLSNTPVRFGTNWIPVPDTSVRSVRPHYRYPTLRQVRYDLNTGAPILRHVR